MTLLGEAQCGQEERSTVMAQRVKFEAFYPWYVLFAALDVMMTWVVLEFGGVEANTIAVWVIRYGGLPGMIALKFSSVVLVIVIAEYVGRQNYRLGRGLCIFAIAASVFPVCVAFADLGIRTYGPASTLPSNWFGLDAANVNPAGLQKNFERITKHEIMFGEGDSGHVPVDVAEDQVDAADLPEP